MAKFVNILTGKLISRYCDQIIFYVTLTFAIGYFNVLNYDFLVIVCLISRYCFFRCHAMASNVINVATVSTMCALRY